MKYSEKYLNPFTDFGFKKLFGEEASKVYLIDFLNSVFEGFIPEISELNYHKNEYLGLSKLDRNVIFDLYCKDKQGNRFIIELQKAQQEYFRERTVFYSTFAIQEQANKGRWDFKLDTVYTIGILNFNFHPDPNKYVHLASILDIETHEIVVNTLKFAYIECPKFNKTLTQKSSKKDKWLYTLTQLNYLNNCPSELQEHVFEDFFERANVFKLSPKDRANYNVSEKYYRDLHNIEAQNLAKGIEQGIQQGIQQGIEQGKAEAENKAYQEKLAIARKLKARGFSAQEIMDDTGLSLSEMQVL